jgi:hypothetical protein
MAVMGSILALGMVIVFIYQFGLLDYARGEQITYMKERYYYPNDWQWFLHSLNYTRTRLLDVGDTFLFRPGFYAVVAMFDIFLRDQPMIVGLSSIVLHWLVAILLYLLLRIHFKGTFAFLFALFFASQYAGIDLIVWRHLSPYMVSIVFALAGFLIAFSKRSYKNGLAFIFFLGSLFFHESLVPSFFLLGMMLAILFSSRTKFFKKSVLSLSFIFILSGAVIVYVLFDILSWWVSKPSLVLNSAEHFTFSGDFLFSSIQNFLIYLGAATQAVFNPGSVDLVWNRSELDRFKWDIFQHDPVAYIGWTILATMLLGSVVTIASRRIIQSKERSCDVIVLWACCGLISLAAIFSFGRLAIRATQYSMYATYYYWFFAFYYIIIIKYLLDELTDKFPWLKEKKFIPIVCILMGIMILGQAMKARETIEKNYNGRWAQQLQTSIQIGQEYFHRHPEACLDEKMQLIEHKRGLLVMMPLYLYQYTCGRTAASSVVHFAITPNGEMQFENGPYQ